MAVVLVVAAGVVVIVVIVEEELVGVVFVIEVRAATLFVLALAAVRVVFVVEAASEQYEYCEY